MHLLNLCALFSPTLSLLYCILHRMEKSYAKINVRVAAEGRPEETRAADDGDVVKWSWWRGVNCSKTGHVLCHRSLCFFMYFCNVWMKHSLKSTSCYELVNWAYNCIRCNKIKWKQCWDEPCCISIRGQSLPLIVKRHFTLSVLPLYSSFLLLGWTTSIYCYW